jgi:ABC-type phosphate transport system permease subunit
VNLPAVLLILFISLITIFITYKSIKNWDEDIYKNLWPEKIDTDNDLYSTRDKVFALPVFIASVISAILSLYLSY